MQEALDNSEFYDLEEYYTFATIATGLILLYEGDYDMFVFYSINEEKEYHLEWGYTDDWDWGRSSIKYY